MVDEGGRRPGVHDRIEANFARLGTWIVRNRWLLVASILVLTGLLTARVPELRSDNSVQSFLRPDDPARVAYDRFRWSFGQDDVIVAAVRPREIFDLDFLERLRAFHTALEDEVPHLAEVRSLWNARDTHVEGDALVVGDLLEDWPRNERDLANLQLRVFDNPLYRNTLISADRTITTVTIEPEIYSVSESDQEILTRFEDEPGSGEGASAPDSPLRFLTNDEAAEMCARIEEITARFRADDFEIHLAGGFLGNYHTTRMIAKDVQILLSGTVVVIAFALALLFGRLAAVVLPLLAIVFSLMATFGVMVVLDIPASVSAQMVPPLLLTIGTCAAIHLLVHFFRILETGATRQEAVAAALGRSGLPITMASLTTSAGLMSFATAELAQIANLGIVAPIGVVLSLLYVLFFLTALLAIVPVKGRSRLRAGRLEDAIKDRLARFGALASRRPWAVVACFGIALAAATAGLLELRIARFPMEWLPQQDSFRRSAEFMDEHLGGIGTLEVVIDAQRSGALQDPGFLSRIETAAAEVAHYDDGALRVSKTISLVDVSKEIHKALNNGEEAFYAIPQDRRLLAQELLLFENSGTDDLEELTDRQYRYGRVSLRIPLADDMHLPVFIAAMERVFHDALGDAVALEITGLKALFARTHAAINSSMIRSYALALLTIAPLMIFLIGNLRLAFVVAIPNLFPVYLTLGLMGATSIALDDATLLVGSIIIGIAVDDTIHFMHSFRRAHNETGVAARAVQRALDETGAGLLFTTLVITAGFAVLAFAYMNSVRNFAILATFATVCAFLADILLAPALVVIVSRRRGEAVAVPPVIDHVASD